MQFVDWAGLTVAMLLFVLAVDTLLDRIERWWTR